MENMNLIETPVFYAAASHAFGDAERGRACSQNAGIAGRGVAALGMGTTFAVKHTPAPGSKAWSPPN